MNNFRYKSFDNFVLRVPLLSLNYIQSIFANKDTSDEDLKRIYENSKIQEAIFLASPILHSELLKWLNNELSNAKKIERLKESLTKYLLRMGSRCTPFGLFAGYGLGKIGNKNQIELDDDQKYYAHLRLDMNYLCALAIDLSKIREIKEQIRFFPNSSIYKSGEKLRYVEYRYNNSKRNHFVVAVEDSEYLQQVLNTSKEGAQIKDLANLLVDDVISFDEAKLFIEELIDSQLLISELEPSVAGAEFLDQIIEILKPLKNIDNIIVLLQRLENDIIKVRNKEIGIPADIYKKIIEKLSKLETKYDIKYLFQTDLVISAKELKLNSDISNDVLKGIELMNKLTPNRTNENLLKFKEAFYERYEEREVPLLQALDVESGVGYIQHTDNGDLNPLVDDIALLVGKPQNDYNIKWNKLESLLLKKYNETLSKGLSEIEITDEDVKDFNANWDDLPSTFNAMVEIISSSETNERPIIKFSSAGGSSAANLLGRFCHSSSDLYSYVNSITATEKDIFQNSVLAEIVHLPESRTGNILLRPQLRDFEIPYLAKSTVSEDSQISIKDIVVSVKNGKKVVLSSKSLNKEIIPRLSNAHNFSNNALPVYQFLCDLQTQDLRAGVGFNWGALSNEYGFLPRVKYKNIILSEAIWNIKKEEFKKVIEAKDDANIEKEAKLWKMRHNLPDYVLLADGDNELLFHLNNTLCIKTLLSLVKKRPAFQLKEFLFNAKDAIVKRRKDSFTNQIVFSFFRSLKN
ncbi:MAG: lantibiotic dehydratase family protein [Marinifilaceae bacterium]